MKILKPKLEDYLKQSKGQNPFPFTGNNTSEITQDINERVINSSGEEVIENPTPPEAEEPPSPPPFGK